LGGLPFLVVEVGDGLDVLVRQVGEQAGDIAAGMLLLLAPLERGDEGVEEALQPGQHAPEEGRIHLGVGSQLLTAGSKATPHRLLLPEGAVLRKGFVGNDLSPAKEGPQSNYAAKAASISERGTMIVRVPDEIAICPGLPAAISAVLGFVAKVGRVGWSGRHPF